MLDENLDSLNPLKQEKEQQELKRKELQERIKNAKDPDDLRDIDPENLSEEMKKILEQKKEILQKDKEEQEKIEKEAEEVHDRIVNPNHHRDEEDEKDKEKTPDLFTEMLQAVVGSPDDEQIPVATSDIVLEEVENNSDFVTQDDQGNQFNSAPLSDSQELVIDDETTQKARREYSEGATEKEEAKQFYWKEQPENRDLLSKEGAIRENESFLSIAGIAEDSSVEDARKVYLKLSRQYHPDKVMQQEGLKVGGVENLDETAKQRIESAKEVFETIKQSYDIFQQNWEKHKDINPENMERSTLSFITDNFTYLEKGLKSMFGIESGADKEKTQEPVSVADPAVIDDKSDVNSEVEKTVKVLIDNHSTTEGENKGKNVRALEERKAKQQSSMHDID